MVAEIPVTYPNQQIRTRSGSERLARWALEINGGTVCWVAHLRQYPVDAFAEEIWSIPEVGPSADRLYQRVPVDGPVDGPYKPELHRL
jgi:hypothetical protein